MEREEIIDLISERVSSDELFYTIRDTIKENLTVELEFKRHGNYYDNGDYKVTVKLLWDKDVISESYEFINIPKGKEESCF